MMLSKVTRNGWHPPSSEPLREAATLAAIQCYWNCTALLQSNHLCLHAETRNPQAITPFYTSALAPVSCSFLSSCSAFEQRYCGLNQAAAIAKYVDLSKPRIHFSLPGRTYTGCWSNDEQKSYSKRLWHSLLCLDWIPIRTFPILKKNFFCSAICG